MTVLWANFNDSPRLRRRTPHSSTGQVYYGRKLADLLDGTSRRPKTPRWFWGLVVVVSIGAIIFGILEAL